MAEAETYYRKVYDLPDPRAKDQFNLVFVGNSFGEVTPLPSHLIEQCGISPASFYNVGYGGETTAQIDRITYPEEAKNLIGYLAATGKPTVALLQEMSNDLLGAPAEAMAHNVQTFWETCRKDYPAIPIVVATCLPRGGAQEASSDAARNSANEKVRSALKGVPGVFLADLADSNLDPAMAPDGSSKDTRYYGDGVHPTEVGCDVIAKIEAPVITQAARMPLR